ncbi:GNAT family N-acetyltransferase [Psychromonas sp. GE-S-Ul-11]|uniref:GNAT family N-acetyltransferase n=1 Tax=Psychromonas sp. GE-S-Ul-11 TaxID=3241170 RepID=UPI00390C9723
MSAHLHLYHYLKQLAEHTHHRQLFSLQGSQSWCFTQMLQIIKQQTNQYQWCGEGPSSITTTPYAQLLGQDVDLLILNMQPGFDANMFAAAEGSVRGGGVIILLLPDSSTKQDNFFNYIQVALKRHSFPCIKENDCSQPFLTPSSVPTSVTKPMQLHLDEQQQAIQSIIKTQTGHRRRPLVLTANRGRGKSAALGIAAASLINQGVKHIIVSAPSKQSVTTLYKHAQTTLQVATDISRLQFIAPDTLHSEQPKCDLLIIDEAAAIPLKLLVTFAQRYARVVFSSTQFGYEGSGRGFALRFQQQLDVIAPDWRKQHLSQAIRWADNDPVEAFTLSTLCFADQSNGDKQDIIDKPNIRLINQSELLQSPGLIKQIFLLLVNAHYQTKPSDLSSLLNDRDLSIIIMQQKQKLLAVAVINHEGNFDQIACQQIYQGHRRPKGHLIAQSLTFHSGFPEAGMHSYARIQRIAVQPHLQDKTLGSQLIDWVTNWAIQQQFDHLCASFAASEKLLSFWLQQNLQVLRIGTKRDKSSGQHSFMVNLPISESGKILHQSIRTAFIRQVKVQFSRQLQHLDPSIIQVLWPQLITHNPPRMLINALFAYINANRSYENVEYLLIELLYHCSLTVLTQQQQAVVIAKIIQNHSWSTIVKEYGFTGQKQAQAFIKDCICDLLTHNQETTHTNET